MLSDKELVERSLRGESEAFHGLVDRYRDALYRFVFRFLGHHEDASEIAQEAFARAWEKLRTYDRKRSFRVWLFSIAANLARDLLRKRGRRGTVFSTDALDATPGGLSPVREAAEKEEHERLRDALDRLSDEKRLAVVMRYYEGLSLTEMEEITGEGKGTLKVRLFRARKDLLRELDGR
jgi:RNA polymerase sigma-70 factor (ECF subfamily)